jgi:hypothetical protein
MFSLKMDQNCPKHVAVECAYILYIRMNLCELLQLWDNIKKIIIRSM